MTLIKCIKTQLDLNKSTLLKVSSNLSSHSTFFKDNGYSTILECLSDHVTDDIIVRLKLDYGYATVF